MVRRVLLIWLLALALPAQGVLAATMAFCGAAMHPAAMSAAHDDHAAHAHDGHAADVQGDSHTCSVCASCCSAAALHDPVPKLPQVDLGVTVFATVTPVVEPFEAGGPERPPRRLLV